MKATFKFALMGFAALAMIACDDPKDPKGGGDEPEEPEEPEFVSPISVSDNSIADWDNVPANYLVSITGDAAADKNALKSAKVYADQMYLNILVEWDDAQITDKSWVPFHIYFDVDNSDATGGYGDEFADANTDIMTEGGIFSEDAPVSYNPAVFAWGGGVGENGWLWGDQTVTHDESDKWGALIAEGELPVGASQTMGNMIEIQILREMIPATFAETFGIGFDIQQNWSSVGILPNAAVSAEGSAVLAPKAKVTIDQTFYTAE